MFFKNIALFSVLVVCLIAAFGQTAASVVREFFYSTKLSPHDSNSTLLFQLLLAETKFLNVILNTTTTTGLQATVEAVVMVAPAVLAARAPGLELAELVEAEGMEGKEGTPLGHLLAPVGKVVTEGAEV